MKDLLRIMFIPIIGCLAIGVMFLLVVWGGYWNDTIENEAGRYGFATADLPQATDARFTVTADCDGNTYRPVCGFDGDTYDNACFAVRAGTRVAHLGACGTRNVQ